MPEFNWYVLIVLPSCGKNDKNSTKGTKIDIGKPLTNKINFWVWVEKKEPATMNHENKEQNSKEHFIPIILISTNNFNY